MDRQTRLQADFNVAEDMLLQAEVALNKFKIAIENIDREIGILTVVEGNLTANLNVLKRRDIIPLASLYAKTRIDLLTARNRRSILRIDRENHLKAQERAEKFLEQARERYQLALKLLKFPDNNVIKVNFGRRDSGQE